MEAILQNEGSKSCRSLFFHMRPDPRVHLDGSRDRPRHWVEARQRFFAKPHLRWPWQKGTRLAGEIPYKIACNIL
jgi:hypothetical protein